MPFLSSLKIVDLSNKKLEVLEVNNFPENADFLKVNNNLFSSIPYKSISISFPSLKVLSFSKNKIVEIEEDIKLTLSLEKLVLSFNKISIIAPEINLLVNLKKLDLSSNELVCFPEALIGMKNLKSLNLSNNKIKYLTLSIIEMANLKSLKLSGNPLISPPFYKSLKSLSYFKHDGYDFGNSMHRFSHNNPPYSYRSKSKKINSSKPIYKVFILKLNI